MEQWHLTQWQKITISYFLFHQKDKTETFLVFDNWLVFFKEEIVITTNESTFNTMSGFR